MKEGVKNQEWEKMKYCNLFRRELRVSIDNRTLEYVSSHYHLLKLEDFNWKEMHIQRNQNLQMNIKEITVYAWKN